MSELISNLNTIESCKLDIKSAIEAKGVDMTGVSLPGYATAIGSISTSQFVTTTLNVSQNGTYTPGQGVDGYSEVVVSVPQSTAGYSFSQCVARSYLLSVIDDTAVTRVAPWALAGGYWFYSNGGITFYSYPTKITSVNLPNVTFVGVYGLAYNSMLTYLSLPKCKQLMSNAFEGCGLISIDLPSCSYILEKVFLDCKSLISMSLPSCVKIDVSAFAGCTSLTNIYLPICTNIASNAFNGCTLLSEVNLPACTEIRTYAFQNCKWISNVSLPVCKIIDRNAFDNCIRITDLNLPACTTINSSAFQNCSGLLNISLPVCSTIGQQAFSNTNHIQTITLGYSSVVNANNAGINAANVTAIYVPASLVDAYKSNAYWQYFASVITSIPE